MHSASTSRLKSAVHVDIHIHVLESYAVEYTLDPLQGKAQLHKLRTARGAVLRRVLKSECESKRREYVSPGRGLRTGAQAARRRVSTCGWEVMGVGR